MNNPDNFFRVKFHEFFMENHPDLVCSFPSRDDYHKWIIEYSSNAETCYKALINSNISDNQAEELVKEEYLGKYKFSPYHHFLSIFEENYPGVYERFVDSQLNTFIFLSYFFFCQPVFDKFPYDADFAYSDDMDNQILSILSARLKHHNLV